LGEELSILESCCLRPMMRNSVLEELRVRRFADIRDCPTIIQFHARLLAWLLIYLLTYLVSYLLSISPTVQTASFTRALCHQAQDSSILSKLVEIQYDVQNV